MADIELVIRIPEEMYKNIQNRDWQKDDRKWFSEEWRAIRNGTPLPKGHGRLIDADVIKDFKDKIKHYKKDYAFSQEEILNIMERFEIKYRKTIIEADKENDDEN